MKKNIKIVLYIFGTLIFTGASIFGIKFMLDTSYRNRLPEDPDFQASSIFIKNQIKEAGKKAYLNPSVENIGQLALIYHANGFSDRAISCYQLAIQKVDEKHRRDWVWSYYLGCLYLEKGESKSAIASFRKVLENSPRNYQALFYQGEACQNLGYNDQARQLFKRVYLINMDETALRKTSRELYFPIQLHAGYKLAQIYLNANQPDSAEFILKELLKKNWTFGPAYRLLGEVYGKKGEAGLSLKYTNRSNDQIMNVPYADTLLDKLSLISRSDKYLLQQIESARMSYNFNWELQICMHALKYVPENKFVLSNLLSLYFFQGREKEVLPLLDRHLKFFSEDFNELIRVAGQLSGKGYEAEALKYFEQAKKLQPNNSQLAISLLERGKKKEAADLISEQLKKNPDNEQILTDAVHIYVTTGDKEKARTLIGILTKINPSNTECKKATGLLLEMEGNLKDAVPIYEEVAKAKDVSIIKYLASIYLKDQKWDKAIQNFRLGLENSPNDADFLEPLGRLLISCPDAKLRNIEEGKEYSERAYTHHDSPIGIRILAARNLATAYAILGDKQMAVNYMNITLNMVRQINADPQQYMAYFEMLRQQYHLS